MSQWMTSGRSRLKARQKQTFAQRSQQRALVVAPHQASSILPPSQNAPSSHRRTVLQDSHPTIERSSNRLTKRQRSSNMEIISGEQAKSKYSVNNPIRRRGIVVTARKRIPEHAFSQKAPQNLIPMRRAGHSRRPVRNPSAVSYSQTHATGTRRFEYSHRSPLPATHQNGFYQNPPPPRDEEYEFSYHQQRIYPQEQERFLPHHQPRPPFQGKRPSYQRRMEDWEEPQQQHDVEPSSFVVQQYDHSRSESNQVPAAAAGARHGQSSQTAAHCQSNYYNLDPQVQPQEYFDFDDTTTLVSTSASLIHGEKFGPSVEAKNMMLTAEPWRRGTNERMISTSPPPKESFEAQSVFCMDDDFSSFPPQRQPSAAAEYHHPGNDRHSISGGGGIARFQRKQPNFAWDDDDIPSLQLFNNGVEVNQDGESLFGPSTE